MTLAAGIERSVKWLAILVIPSETALSNNRLARIILWANSGSQVRPKQTQPFSSSIWQVVSAMRTTSQYLTVRCKLNALVAHSAPPLYPHGVHIQILFARQAPGNRLVCDFGREPERLSCCSSCYHLFQLDRPGPSFQRVAFPLISSAPGSAIPP